MGDRVGVCYILGRAAESTQELRLVDRLDPQHFGLLQLAARLLTRHDGVGPLAHAAGHRPPAASMSSIARARERVGSVPVRTKVLPASAPSASCARGSEKV